MIRIFGIFTHVQLDRTRFWDSLSQQLQQRGPDYVKRCTLQDEPLSTCNNAILPMIFPPLPNPAQDVPQATQLIRIHEEDIKDVSEMDG